MSENGEIYTAGKNFTLPPAVTAWTNSTSACELWLGASHTLGETIYHKVHTLHKVRDLTTIFKAFDGEHHTPWEGNETSNHKTSNI